MKHPFDLDQQTFYDGVLKGETLINLLTGHAGTGKTHVFCHLQYAMAQQGNKVLCVYPTHQARNVAMDRMTKEFPEFEFMPSEIEGEIMGFFKDTDIIFKTIHAMIGVSPKSEGKKGDVFSSEFEEDDERLQTLAVKLKVELQQYSEKGFVVFVDEVSMISWKFLSRLKALITQAGWWGAATFVFCGDPEQLPPIDGRPCLPLIHELMGAHPDLWVELETVHRTEGLGIIDCCTKIRETGKLPKRVVGNDVSIIKDKKDFVSQFEDAIAAEQDVVALSYTNRKVMEYTRIAANVRSQTPDPIQEGFYYFAAKAMSRERELYDLTFGADVMMRKDMRRPDYKENKKISLFTGDLLKIVKVHGVETIMEPWANGLSFTLPHVTIEKVNTGVKYQCYVSIRSEHDKTNSSPAAVYLDAMRQICIDAGEYFRNGNGAARYIQDSFDDLEKNHPTLHSVFENNRDVQFFASRYDREGRNAPRRLVKLLWPLLFYKIQSSIMLMRSVSALTCHTAQGSGRGKVFLDTTDFKNVDKEKKRKLLYTGASRAENELVILR